MQLLGAFDVVGMEEVPAWFIHDFVGSMSQDIDNRIR
jgi:hypothetical protein